MLVKKLPVGTRLYLTKPKNKELYIQPNKTLVNDNLVVAYDVRNNGEIIIPKGTRVLGDWVTESYPTVAAQLQLTKIFLDGIMQPIAADSDVIEAITTYNNEEVNNASYLYKLNQLKMQSGTTRRITNVQCNVKGLKDNHLDTIYLEILTKEIPVTIVSDFNAIKRV
jgi:hypothetical protein